MSSADAATLPDRGNGPMNYAFMSFSCPDLTLLEMMEAAQRYGYRGIEPRSGGGHQHGIELQTTEEQRNEIKQLSIQKGIDLCCLAISAKFSDPATWDAQKEETKQYIKLAKDVGAPRLRVFGGIIPEGVTREQAT